VATSANCDFHRVKRLFELQTCRQQSVSSWVNWSTIERLRMMRPEPGADAISEVFALETFLGRSLFRWHRWFRGRRAAASPAGQFADGLAAVGGVERSSIALAARIDRFIVEGWHGRQG